MSSDGDLWAPRRIRRRLRKLGRRPQISDERISDIDRSQLVDAAVLIALTEIDEQMCAVFTRRPDSMPEHSGEISFPGGRREELDPGLISTALREAEEEIGLQPDDVTVCGNLVCMPTVTGYEVTAFVGEFAQPYELEPDPREIETLFLAPLPVLADPQRHRTEKHRWREFEFDIHYYDYDGHVIWGATGYMLHLLLTFLTEGDVG